MTSTREGAIQALLATVVAALPLATVLRNPAAEDFEVPAGGLVVVRDGDPGEPEVTMGVRTYAWVHRAEVEISAFEVDDDDRSATVDDLVNAISAAITANTSLTGAVDYAQPLGPSITHEAAEGGVPFGRAVIPVELYYVTTSPTG